MICTRLRPLLSVLLIRQPDSTQGLQTVGNLMWTCLYHEFLIRIDQIQIKDPGSTDLFFSIDMKS